MVLVVVFKTEGPFTLISPASLVRIMFTCLFLHQSLVRKMEPGLIYLDKRHLPWAGRSASSKLDCWWGLRDCHPLTSPGAAKATFTTLAQSYETCLREEEPHIPLRWRGCLCVHPCKYCLSLIKGASKQDKDEVNGRKGKYPPLTKKPLTSTSSFLLGSCLPTPLSCSGLQADSDDAVFNATICTSGWKPAPFNS